MLLTKTVRRAVASRAFRGLWLVVFALIVSGSAILAAAEHHGQVKFSGLPVPGATVTATGADGKTFTTITDDTGVYSFPDLPNGSWKIKVEMVGFTPLTQDVTIAADTPPGSWDMKMLALSEIAGAVAAPVVKPAETAPAANVASTAKPGKNTPATKAPAPAFQRADVNATSSASAAPPAPAPSDATPPSAASAADLSSRAADGLLINGSSNNGAASPFAQNPAFGNNRRGGRSLYTGSIGMVLDNSALDANSYSLSGQNTPKPDYNRLQGLFSLGGPLRIPHVMTNAPPQFFVGYQRQENRNATTASGVMPTDAERMGDLSSVTAPIIDPSTGLPFSGNQIPTRQISPQAAALLRYFPEPNFTVGSHYNYQLALINVTHSDSLNTRFNKTLNQRNQLSGFFNLTHAATSSVNLFGFLDNGRSLGWNSQISVTHRPSPRTSSTFTVNFSRSHNQNTPFFANRLNVSGAAGITGNNQDPVNWGPPSLSFGNSGTSGLSDANNSVSNNQTGVLTYAGLWNHSPHNLTYGADFRRQEYNTISQQNPRGGFGFTGAATGSDFADFLLGIPDTSQIAFGNADKYLRQSVYDAFLTDDWRVRSGVTLNAGIRWEYEAPMTEKYGRLVNLDIAPNFTAAAPVIANNPTGSVTGTQYPSSLVSPSRNGIQPRLALAWRPLAASSLIVRAGYGIYRNTSVYRTIANQMVQQAPLSKTLMVSNSPATPLTLANGFSTPPNVLTNNFAVDPNFKIGNAQTWQLSVQRDLPAALAMTATYQGTKGTRLPQEFLPNTYPLGGVSPCPGCPAGYTYLTSNGNSTRQSGQIQIRRRLRNGFTASTQYTYSKSIDDAGLPGVVSAQNWLNLRGERALSGFDQRHQLVVQGQYTTGMGLGGGALLSGWRGSLFKEWTVLSNLTLGSGSPMTPVLPGALPGSGVAGLLRPNLTGASIYAAPAGVFLNPAAFATPAPGQYGNAARNSITGPSQFSLSGTLQRTIRMGDRINADLQFTAQNLLNHVTFSSWNPQVGSTLFGTPQGASQMRDISTRLNFRF